MANIVKFNRANKKSAITNISSCNDQIEAIKDYLSKFHDDAVSEYSTWNNYVDPIEKNDGFDDDGNVKFVYYSRFDNANFSNPYSAYYSAESCCKSHKDNFTSKLSSFSAKCNKICNNVETLLTKINNCLNAIENAADAFDNSSVSLSDIIDSLESAGLADNITIETDGDTEIVYYNVYDSNGELVGHFTIAEMVNSFYTYAGSAMSGIVSANVLIDGYDKMSDADKDRYLNNLVSGIGNNVYQLMGAGFMSIAAESDIKGLYETVYGSGSYASLTSKYDSLYEDSEDSNKISLLGSAMINECGGFLTGGAAIVASAAYTLGDNLCSDEQAKEAKDRIAGYENTEKVETEPEVVGGNPYTGNDVTGGSPSNNDVSSDDTIDTLEPNENEDADDIAEEVLEETQDENINEVDDRITEVVESSIPDTQEDITLSNDDIDAMANEEFFKNYNGESLTERRQADVEAFEELYNQENKEELTNLFEEIGYSSDEVSALIENKELGLQAYMLNSQNKEMAEIANKLAEDMGVNDFDTVYDDTPNYSNFSDGDVQAALSDISGNESIADVKNSFDTVKNTYVESVSKANDSIASAQQAKTNLETVKAEIEAQAGTDTNNWTDSQVEKYNNATQSYNSAVAQANSDVAAAGEAKNAYTEAKTAYEEAKNELYEQIRKEAQENGGNSSSSNDTLKENVETGSSDRDIIDDFLSATKTSDDVSDSNSQGQNDYDSANDVLQDNNNNNDNNNNTESNSSDESAESNDDILKQFLGM